MAKSFKFCCSKNRICVSPTRPRQERPAVEADVRASSGNKIQQQERGSVTCTFYFCWPWCSSSSRSGSWAGRKSSVNKRKKQRVMCSKHPRWVSVAATVALARKGMCQECWSKLFRKLHNPVKNAFEPLACRWHPRRARLYAQKEWK